MEKEKNGVENVTIQLKGEEAIRFRAYKAAEFLNLNSEAGRRLILQGLARHEAAKAKPKSEKVA